MRQDSHPIRATLAACALAGILALPVRSDEGALADLPETAVPSRHFLMTLRPVDEESRDARQAELYMTRLPGAGWRLVGDCEVTQTPDGPRFHRAVSVPVDGAYYFAASAGDAAGKAPPPGPDTPPQMRVIVDTRSPEADLSAPKGGESVRPETSLLVRWTTRDEHLDEAPVTLAWSDDAGRSWRSFATDLPATGSREWRVPQTDGARLWLRLTVRDTAGNAAVATIRQPLLVDAAPGLDPSAEAPSAMARAAGVEAPRAELVLGQLPEEMEEVLPVETEERAEAIPQEAAAPAPSAPAPVVVADEPERRGYDGSAYLAYVMAGNLVRQGRLKDSVRYYRAAVEADPDFGDAWADLAMVYRELGRYERAHEAAQAALRIDPDRSLYHHVLGEVYFAEAWSTLQESDEYESVRKGGELAGKAVTAFGEAIEIAEADDRLAARADSFFRLGEICYFVNRDRLGARAYWSKILDLHAPGPMLFEIAHAPDEGVRSEAIASYARLTEMEIELETWQRWAREYLDQLGGRAAAEPESVPEGARRPSLPESDPADADAERARAASPGAPAPQADYLRPDYGSAPTLRDPSPSRRGRGFRIFD